MNFRISVFENENEEGGQVGPLVPDSFLAWLEEAVSRLDLDAGLEPAGLMPPGTLDVIEIHLCTRTAMDEVFEAEGAMGLHLVSTPDGDPFGDESPLARAYRLAVVFDIAEMERRLGEEIEADGSHAARYLHEYEESEAATVFHEIAHAVLFAANSDFNSPQDCETACEAGDIDNDLFDMSTGYGIRFLEDRDGNLIDAADADHARDMMEEWCEHQGRLWVRSLPRNADGSCGFYAACGIDPPVGQELANCAP